MLHNYSFVLSLKCSSETHHVCYDVYHCAKPNEFMNKELLFYTYVYQRVGRLCKDGTDVYMQYCTLLGGWWDYEGGLTPAACPLHGGGHLHACIGDFYCTCTAGLVEVASRDHLIPSPVSHNCYS